MDVYLNGKRLRLDPAASIGKGGEADVYDLRDGRALKVFKTPDHPDLDGMPEEQQAAERRLAVHQRKLRAFPKNLPARVVAPLELATDRAGKNVVGYAMPLLDHAEVLMRFGDPGFRARGIDDGKVVALLGELRATVEGVHQAGVVIGDFNDLNVLVRGAEAHVIDADSFQFGPFACEVFTEKFVDPLLCDPNATAPVLSRPFNAASDWYAYAVMVMQSLLFVGPYGGVYKPKQKPKLSPSARPLARVTVFDAEVVYPKPARHFRVLPDELLEELHRVFERDARGPFPKHLLDGLEWTTCATCHTAHARRVCPVCLPAAPAAVKQTSTVRGRVSATRVFATEGSIVHAQLDGGALRFVFHANGAYRREDGAVLLDGPMDPELRFAIEGEATAVARGGQLAVLERGALRERLNVDVVGNAPAFAANGRHLYRSEAGRLLRDGELGPEPIGEVLQGQTRLWVGERMGLGFYRAGNLSVTFVFDAERRGLNDAVKTPPLRGQLVDAHAAVDSERAWLFTAVQHAGKTWNRCVCVGANGAVLGVAETEAGDGSWLGAFGGACAAGGALFVPTDEGLARVEAASGLLPVTRAFPDTEPFVNAGSQLFAGSNGLYVVTQHEVRLLTLS